MLHICCIRAGEAFSPAYVSALFDMVRRNLAEGFAGEFVCFTDQPDKLEKGITVCPLPADLSGWWSKLALFRKGLFPDGDRVLFFDLDTLITGRLTAGLQGPCIDHGSTSGMCCSGNLISMGRLPRTERLSEKVTVSATHCVQYSGSRTVGITSLWKCLRAPQPTRSEKTSPGLSGLL